ncbi:hypothetical protein D3C81_1101820 [compost metagenome]|jgi:hypothetical protein
MPAIEWYLLTKGDSHIEIEAAPSLGRVESALRQWVSKERADSVTRQDLNSTRSPACTHKIYNLIVLAHVSHALQHLFISGFL